MADPTPTKTRKVPASATVEQDQPPMSPVAQDLKDYVERITAILALTAIGSQLAQQAQSNPAMASVLGPSMIAGIQAALQTKAREYLNDVMGRGNTKYMDSLQGQGMNAPTMAANIQQAVTGQANVNNQYKQQQAVRSQGVGPLAPQAPWLNQQGWQAVQQTQPWYVQQGLLNAPQTATWTPAQKTQMKAARKDMTPEQQQRFDAAFGEKEGS